MSLCRRIVVAFIRRALLDLMCASLRQHRASFTPTIRHTWLRMSAMTMITVQNAWQKDGIVHGGPDYSSEQCVLDSYFGNLTLSEAW